jgi:competence protein ComEA
MKQTLILALLAATLGLIALPVPSFAADNTAASAVTAPVNINQATAEQLQTLPGVGPSLSARILDYRTENGPFKSLDQLVEVKGIGEVKLAKIKPRLSLK